MRSELQHHHSSTFLGCTCRTCLGHVRALRVQERPLWEVEILLSWEVAGILQIWYMYILYKYTINSQVLLGKSWVQHRQQVQHRGQSGTRFSALWVRLFGFQGSCSSLAFFLVARGGPRSRKWIITVESTQLLEGKWAPAIEKHFISILLWISSQ